MEQARIYLKSVIPSFQYSNTPIPPPFPLATMGRKAIKNHLIQCTLIVYRRINAATPFDGCIPPDPRLDSPVKPGNDMKWGLFHFPSHLFTPYRPSSFPGLTGESISLCDDSIFLDSGSRGDVHRSSGMTFSANDGPVSKNPPLLDEKNLDTMSLAIYYE